MYCLSTVTLVCKPTKYVTGILCVHILSKIFEEAKTSESAIDKIYFQCFRSLCTPFLLSEEHGIGTNGSSSMKCLLLQGPLSTEVPNCPRHLHRPHDHHLTILYFILQSNGNVK